MPDSLKISHIELSNNDLMIEIYRRMQSIRLAEEEIAARYGEQKMRCPTHLSVGQETVPAVAGALLKNSDYAISTHRSHAHYIGKGGDLGRMIAEIYGKATGCARGRGGSMHLIDTSVGFMGSTAIVGNSIPLGVGFGLSFRLKKSDQVSIVYLGDAAVEEGAFYESANFAVLKKLPVIFICENNLYSVYSHLKSRQPAKRKIYELAQAIGLISIDGDGNDVFDSFKKISAAIEYARSGLGPVFLELYTYRWREHCGPSYDNNLGYRTEEEFLQWKKRDPIELYKNKLLDLGITESTLESIAQLAQSTVLDAFVFAESSPFPEQIEAYQDLFKEQ
jgi:TPP-dependent pyruvate/acetoin dehydrogenase alpha subunit